MKTFEAVARLGRMTKAAAALGLSQPAVSQQIAALERALAVDLFNRPGGRVTLTPEGERYYVAVREALTLLATATGQIADRKPTETLTVSALPSVAQLWLVPRLLRLRAHLPGVQLNIHVSYDHVDFLADGVDVVIKFGLNNYPGGRGELLMSEVLFPVCSPALLERQPLNAPADLRSQVLLESFDPRWGEWLAAVGEPAIDSQAAIRLRDPTLVLEAAREGQGVAMGRAVLAAADLQTGRLVRPFPQQIVHEHSYWLVTPAGMRDDARLRIFREWIAQEVDSTVRPHSAADKADCAGGRPGHWQAELRDSPC